MFCGSSASGPLTMDELRRAIEALPLFSQFRVAAFIWAIPSGYGWYKRLAPLIVTQREIGVAVGLGAEINKPHLAIPPGITT